MSNTQFAATPHHSSENKTTKVMLYVLLAAIPGVLMQLICYRWGALIQLATSMSLAVFFEICALKLRRRNYKKYLQDGSALVTGLLLGVALPPLAPWWFVATGIAFAILIGKHLYGGLGNNLFNPAMLGYAFLLVAFPKQATTWLPVSQLQVEHPSFFETISIFFGYSPFTADTFAHATPLDVVKNNNYQTLDELWQSSKIFNAIGGVGVVAINIAYASGGAFLLYKRIISWHAPLGMLASITILAFCFWGGGITSSEGSPLFHLLDGATMLGAFFIITDPVSGATSKQGRLFFGIGVGTLVYIIRVFGNYPDAVAFATLLMNIVAPLLDYYTAPRVYGHKKATRGLK